jgi:hypothetical protein
MRLNFSHADAAEADRGLRVLAGLIRERAAGVAPSKVTGRSLPG